MVARTVTQYARVGVAGLHIEDQVQTKRCGHLLGKQVVSREEFVTRIRAAVIARDSIPGGSDFVIIGRTDSAQVLGMDEAIFRLKLAADAGADVCFIEGVKTKELLESTVKALAPKPVRIFAGIINQFLIYLFQVLVNVISGGLTPSFTTKEAEQMGAKIISECCCPRPSAASLTIHISSLLTRFMRCRGARNPCCHEIIEEDGHGLHIRKGHGVSLRKSIPYHFMLLTCIVILVLERSSK